MTRKLNFRSLVMLAATFLLVPAWFSRRMMTTIGQPARHCPARQRCRMRLTKQFCRDQRPEPSHVGNSCKS